MTAAGVATVARQEFRLRIRAGRWRLLLALWFGVLLLFTVLLRLALGRQGVGAPLEDLGVVLFGGLVLLVLGLALLVAPALAAQSVNGDRERGTLATLQVTRLTAAEIALGKFAAAWGTALVFLLLTVPLVLYAMTQGGVGVARALVVLLVLAVLLGTVCAVSLALSALLTRTTTSGVLAYLAVFALTVGTLVVFGLVTAVTTEETTGTYERTCPTAADLPPDLPPEVREQELSCVPGTETFTGSRTRTDRTWWLLAPNPFVVLADAAPQLPPVTDEELRRREELAQRGVFVEDARDLDPLGGIGREVRGLRRAPAEGSEGGFGPGVEPGVAPPGVVERPVPEPGPVWPTGLAVNALLAAAALLVTVRRLRTPTRDLPRGQRVA